MAKNRINIAMRIFEVLTEQTAQMWAAYFWDQNKQLEWGDSRGDPKIVAAAFQQMSIAARNSRDNKIMDALEQVRNGLKQAGYAQTVWQPRY